MLLCFYRYFEEGLSYISTWNQFVLCFILILLSICLKHIGRADYLVKNLEHPDLLEGRCPESNDQTKLFHRESVGGRNPANHQPQLVIAGLLEINSLRLHQQYVSSFLNGPWFFCFFWWWEFWKYTSGGIRKVPTWSTDSSRVHMFSTSLAAACLERPKLSEVETSVGGEGWWSELAPALPNWKTNGDKPKTTGLRIVGKFAWKPCWLWLKFSPKVTFWKCSWHLSQH